MHGLRTCRVRVRAEPGPGSFGCAQSAEAGLTSGWHLVSPRAGGTGARSQWGFPITMGFSSGQAERDPCSQHLPHRLPTYLAMLESFCIPGHPCEQQREMELWGGAGPAPHPLPTQTPDSGLSASHRKGRSHPPSPPCTHPSPSTPIRRTHPSTMSIRPTQRSSRGVSPCRLACCSVARVTSLLLHVPP